VRPDRQGRAAIAVVCTDRAQHAETTLGDLTWSSGLLRANVGFVYDARADRRKDECVWLDHLDPHSPEYRVHLRCPRCKREIQWTYDTAVRVRDAIPEASPGVSHLDISGLP
jgi:hypothetical protein